MWHDSYLKPSVRVYGPVASALSFSSVRVGLEYAFQQLGAYAGTLPVDAIDDEASYAGADADMAVVCGFTGNLEFACSMADHALVSYVFAPNTDHIAPHIVRNVMTNADRILVPSKSAERTMQEVIQSSEINVDVDLLPHGVLPCFRPDPDIRPPDRFRLLHFAGSSLERKGTLELQKAFRTWKHRKDAELIVVCDGIWYRKLDVDSVTYWAPGAWPQAAVAQYLFVSAVIQPSRGEGFGCVPLEALACGVPVAVTPVGGHLDYAFCETIPMPGVVPIRFAAKRSSLECELGQDAPTLDVDLLHAAMTNLYEDYVDIHQDAQRTSDLIRAEWAWTSVVGQWYYRMPAALAFKAACRQQMDTNTEG